METPNRRPSWVMRHNGSLRMEKDRGKWNYGVNIWIMQITCVAHLYNDGGALTHCVSGTSYHSWCVVTVMKNSEIIQRFVGNTPYVFKITSSGRTWAMQETIGGDSPWFFSMKMTLESELKFCPVRIICWPPRTEHLSMSCFSTMGSSCAERWAAGKQSKCVNCQ